MSLVGDYGNSSSSSSSSEDEENTSVVSVKETSFQVGRVVAGAESGARAAPVDTGGRSTGMTSHGVVDKKRSTIHTKSNETKKKTYKKIKTFMYLPPDIQKALETGVVESDEEEEIQRRQKNRKKAVPPENESQKVATENGSWSSSDLLNRLPPPKHSISVVAPSKVNETTSVRLQEVEKSATSDETTQQHYEQNYAFQHPNAKYAPQIQHHYGRLIPEHDQQVTIEETKEKGKRGRNHERDLERALQQGQLDAVAGEIREVSGISPDAWQRPAEGLLTEEEKQVKVSASFWSTQQGKAVSSARPTRLQRQRHQLNQLAFDAKAREIQLLEMRGASTKTKRETQAKYGW